jgi:hydroxymethylglutaryl-CoA lyase
VATVSSAAITWVEVSPRDGLQNDPAHLDTATKIALIRRLAHAGARRIEVASFVNPKRVPQMADAEAVIAGIADVAGIEPIGLVLNERGAERALATAVGELGAVAVASDALGIANQGQSAAETVGVAARIVAMARAAGRCAQVTIAASFGCPYEGEVPGARVVGMAAELAEAGPREIALADTIGVANPAHVSRLVRAVEKAVAPLPVRVHFHNTRGTGLANVWAAVEAGASVIDGSLGGVGGCPFAAGAAGNIASEDAVYLLERAGVATGLDLARLIDASHWFAGVLGKELPSMVARAGAWPKTA